jgi:hypothetical protein
LVLPPLLLEPLPDDALVVVAAGAALDVVVETAFVVVVVGLTTGTEDEDGRGLQRLELLLRLFFAKAA